LDLDYKTSKFKRKIAIRTSLLQWTLLKKKLFNEKKDSASWDQEFLLFRLAISSCPLLQKRKVRINRLIKSFRTSLLAMFLEIAWGYKAWGVLCERFLTVSSLWLIRSLGSLSWTLEMLCVVNLNICSYLWIFFPRWRILSTFSFLNCVIEPLTGLRIIHADKWVFKRLLNRKLLICCLIH